MKAATKMVKTGEKSQNGSLIKASLNKALRAEAEWDDKDEFLDVIYWMRQILGLILGIVWGLIPLKGIIGLVLFLAVNVGIVYFYYNSFQKIDDEEYGGPSEILKEGLMTSFSTFVVAWIL
ncbi:GEL complex subunit OPTI-like isoform X2 [Mytilus galloprovincialis]